jgi:choline dehydrogenase
MSAMGTAQKEYDYIIVGGGSAGCVLAARLSEDPAISVLLLEAGPASGRWHDSWKIRMPAAFDTVWRNTLYNWCYEGEPEPTLGNRRILQPRGKVLGGSSSINGMCFIRGHPLDFERWVTQGAAGWSYREVLPYFRRLETWEGGENDYRGGSGPVRVRAGNNDCELYGAFLEAGRQAGYPHRTTSTAPEGFAQFQMNVDHGVRASTAHAYLEPARAHQSHVETGRWRIASFEATAPPGVQYARGADRIDVSSAARSSSPAAFNSRPIS